jgi:cytochrome c biogenesis protein CcmG/thiol:disulfide interchange protein DsbE
MKKWITWVPMIIAFPLILFLGWRFTSDSAGMGARRIGGHIPNFKLNELYQNESVNEKNIEGEWAIVNIWATWCTPCIKEHTVLLDISKHHELPIYGIDFKDDAEAARQWLADRGNPYTLVLVDDQGRSSFDWGVIGVPETLLIDPKGIIKHRYAGQLTAEIWHNEFVPLLPPEMQ